MRKIIPLLTYIPLFVSALYVFVVFGLPLFGVYSPFPLFRTDNPFAPASILVFLNLIPFIIVAIAYLFYIFSAFLSLFLSSSAISKKAVAVYIRHELILKLAILISAPFLFPIGFSILVSYIFHTELMFSQQRIILGIVIWLFWFKYARIIGARLGGITALCIALAGIFFISVEIVPEFSPRLHGTFPLDDPKGVYMINYDGDFWLTYYVPETYCWNKNLPGGTLEKTCKTTFVKMGNTVITESPVKLLPYLDTPVKVDGKFIPVIPPVLPGNPYREFCITKPKRDCSASTGPGTWYFSPLNIYKIKPLKE